MEWISGSIFVREFAGPGGAEPGFVMDGHEHAFDHTTIVFAGRWRVRRWRRAVTEKGEPVVQDGEPLWLLTDDGEREGPFHLLIEAQCRHEFAFLGVPVPAWMEPFLAQLPNDQAEAFREQHAKTRSPGWCVYSHRTAQGDVSVEATGWTGGYV